ncbi:MAG: IscS subfamily cysteine desulfurase [Nitrospinae bacterium]|nr:IscS subfamily cysteine desulfurase [Nitrospinota bacterium]
MNLPIYMDNNATTPVDGRVLEAMLPYFCEEYGNAASRNHSFGWRAEEAVGRAREQVARLIGAKPREIIFTSGATESDNLALKGVAEMYQEKGDHIITQVTEHKAVLDTAKRLERQGFEVTYLPVDRDGLVDPDDVRRALRETTILISIMAANNEIGVLQPVSEIGRIAKERGVLFHSDAAQALGKIPVDVKAWGTDLVSLSAHKMYGPKGVGALYVRGRDPRVRLSPMMDGGGHERGMRSGTLDVPGIVGFGAACELAYQEMEAEAERLRALRDRLQSGILSHVEEVYLNGHPDRRLPGTSNLSFAYVEGESLVTGLNDIALSSGSACTSVGHESSHVLKALGLNTEMINSSLRFCLGRFNTEEEVDYVIQKVREVVERLRELSPLYEGTRAGLDVSSVL